MRLFPSCLELPCESPDIVTIWNSNWIYMSMAGVEGIKSVTGRPVPNAADIRLIMSGEAPLTSASDDSDRLTCSRLCLLQTSMGRY